LRNTGATTCAIVRRHANMPKLVIHPFVTRQVYKGQDGAYFLCEVRKAKLANYPRTRKMQNKASFSIKDVWTPRYFITRVWSVFLIQYFMFILDSGEELLGNSMKLLFDQFISRFW